MPIIQRSKQIPLKFYAILLIALISLAAIISITSKGVFEALKISTEVDDSILNVATPRIIESDFKRAIDVLNTKTAPPLDAL